MNPSSDSEDAASRRRAIRKVRESLRPGPDFAQKVEHALRDAEAQAPRAASAGSRALLWMHLPVMLAVLSLMLSVDLDGSGHEFAAQEVVERSLQIPIERTTAVPLDLALHHHGDDWADVSIHAPRGLSMATEDGVLREPSACRADRCRYDFSHRAGEQAPSMQVHVAEPGHYRLRIEHHSHTASVHETLVIRAKPVDSRAENGN